MECLLSWGAKKGNAGLQHINKTEIVEDFHKSASSTTQIQSSFND
jgi:hypothetical protein